MDLCERRADDWRRQLVCCRRPKMGKISGQQKTYCLGNPHVISGLVRPATSTTEMLGLLASRYMSIGSTKETSALNHRLQLPVNRPKGHGRREGPVSHPTRASDTGLATSGVRSAMTLLVFGVQIPSLQQPSSILRLFSTFAAMGFKVSQWKCSFILPHHRELCPRIHVIGLSPRSPLLEVAVPRDNRPTKLCQALQAQLIIHLMVGDMS